MSVDRTVAVEVKDGTHCDVAVSQQVGKSLRRDRAAPVTVYQSRRRSVDMQVKRGRRAGAIKRLTSGASQARKRIGGRRQNSQGAGLALVQRFVGVFAHERARQSVDRSFQKLRVGHAQGGIEIHQIRRALTVEGDSAVRLLQVEASFDAFGVNLGNQLVDVPDGALFAPRADVTDSAINFLAHVQRQTGGAHRDSARLPHGHVQIQYALPQARHAETHVKQV